MGNLYLGSAIEIVLHHAVDNIERLLAGAVQVNPDGEHVGKVKTLVHFHFEYPAHNVGGYFRSLYLDAEFCRFGSCFGSGHCDSLWLLMPAALQ